MANQKILIADDESRLRKLVRDYLTRENYDVIEAADGEEALELVYREPKIDLIILDIMMPKHNGYEVCKEIRETSKVPILMLTAKAEIDDKVEGLDLGANDYLTKPFAAKELLARIRTMIRTQTTQTESILHVGNITLNRATFELTSPTGSFRLANKEFQMMEMFLCNQGHSITHKRLLEKIWGDEKQVQTNVVWMYISYLRKKLEALHANLQITEASHAEYILEVGG